MIMRVTLLNDGGYMTLREDAVGNEFDALPIASNKDGEMFLQDMVQVYVPLVNSITERDSWVWLAFKLNEECAIVTEGK